MFKHDNLFPVLNKWNDDRGDIKSIWSECLSGQAWHVWYLKWKHFKINWFQWNSYVISKCSYKINYWDLILLWRSHTEPPTHWLTDVMLAAATISRLLTNLLHRTIVTKATTHTPRSGDRRRIILQGSSNGSLDSPICLLMTSHCEQLSPMAMLRGGYVYRTVWKQMWARTNSRLVQNTALMNRPVGPLMVCLLGHRNHGSSSRYRKWTRDRAL